VSEPANGQHTATGAPDEIKVGGRLFRKYVVLVASVLGAALLANGLFELWFSYRDHKASLIQIQRQQADAAAAKIGEFIKEIESQLGWMIQLPWSEMTLEERRFDGLRLIRQVPAITELSLIDPEGREQLHLSRFAMDAIGSGKDFSDDLKFIEALAGRTFYGSIYFHRKSEPYMTVALAGARRDTGVAVAEVNLKLIWDVVSQIHIGRRGHAYVVDGSGRLIAHPDISLVLRNTDLSGLAYVQAVRAGADYFGEPARDIEGRRVLTAHAAIPSLGWLVFVDLPLDEAFAPIYSSLARTCLVLLAGLALAVLASLVLARKMVRPIRILQTGAARIGGGALDHRITIATGDELQALGDQFNSMTAQLRDSYATLERKVEERTHQLALANQAKSRFLAAASHDLRQPLHALNLFVAQLRSEEDHGERSRILALIEAAVGAMNELFNALLDISKLDAGVLAPNISIFPVDRLLKRIEMTFAAAAQGKGLRLRVVTQNAWIESDFILLERILLNLVSNAIRYTVKGGVVVGCRRRGDRLCIEVWDSGIGIPEDHRRNIFDEFYQLAGSERDGGLGLGLAIVDRLCRLLDHPIEVRSHPGAGSRFAVSVPRCSPTIHADSTSHARVDQASGKLIVVIDDDALVLDGMRGLLKSWGCGVVTANSADAALAALADHARCPDLIISDYRLTGGKTGFQVIAQLRTAFGVPIPAFLISGDTAPERLREASASGYHLLHKPVLPITLRAVVSQLLKDDAPANRPETAASHDPSNVHQLVETPSSALPQQ
jgi:signal transduction histidine kinase/CheY-like chemotaxis protein